MNKQTNSTGNNSTGNYSTGNNSTGDYSTGGHSIGYYSTGHYSTGHYSTGHWSTGNWSTGDYSTGDRSTGNWSTGNWSTGDYSTGHYSTGHYSTGHWSISNYSTGHFSTEDYSGFGVFDKPCTLEAWVNWEKPNWLFFDLTKWINTSDMTEQEKKDNPEHVTTGGYLKVYDYKTAFQNSYNKATREEQLKIKDCPNFDAEKFYLISGIDVDGDLSNDKNNTETEKPFKTIIIDGQEYELKKITKE